MKEKEFWEYIGKFPVSVCEKCKTVMYGNHVFFTMMVCSTPPAKIRCPNRRCNHTNSSGEVRTYRTNLGRFGTNDYGFTKSAGWWTKRTPFWAI